jgi:hypothetical protein
MDCKKCGNNLPEGTLEECPFCKEPLTEEEAVVEEPVAATQPQEVEQPYIVQIGGREFQAPNIEVLKTWVEETRISHNDLVKEPGSSEWKKASEISELFPDLVVEEDEIAIKQRSFSIPMTIGLVVLIAIIAVVTIMYSKKDVSPPSEISDRVEELRSTIDTAISDFNTELNATDSKNKFEKTLIDFDRIFFWGENIAAKYNTQYVPAEFVRTSVAVGYIRYYSRNKQKHEIAKIIATFYKTAIETYKNIESIDLTKSPSRDQLEKTIGVLDRLQRVFKILYRFRDFGTDIDDPDIKLDLVNGMLTKSLDDLAKYYGIGLGNKQEELRIRLIVQKEIAPQNEKNNQKIESLKRQIKEDELGPGIGLPINFKDMEIRLVNIKELKDPKEGRTLGMAFEVKNKSAIPFFITPDNIRLVILKDAKISKDKDQVVVNAIKYSTVVLQKDKKEEIFTPDKYIDIAPKAEKELVYIIYFSNIPESLLVDDLHNRLEVRVPKNQSEWSESLKQKKAIKEWQAIYFRLTK